MIKKFCKKFCVLDVITFVVLEAMVRLIKRS